MMSDKEKVIETLEHCKQLDFDMAKPTQDAIDYVLALLKSQPQIVRCKDCKHGKPDACGDGVDCDGAWHDDEWFCADGEKKDGE